MGLIVEGRWYNGEGGARGRVVLEGRFYWREGGGERLVGTTRGKLV